MGFGDRLKRLRKERRISMQELADRIGVAKSTYAGYEAEYRQPPLESVQILARALHTSTDYLLGLTDNSSPKDFDKNMRELLMDKDLNWDGIPLNDEELKPIRDLLAIVVRERLPKIIEKQKSMEENKVQGDDPNN